MSRAVETTVVIIVWALLLAFGVAVAQPNVTGALVVLFCTAAVVSLAGRRRPMVAAVASSVGGLTALLGCALASVSLAQAPSRGGTALLLGAAIFGVSGLQHARRVWFGARPRRQA